MKKLALLFALIILCAGTGLAQSGLTEPKPGSAGRKALLNAIRTYDVARNDDLAGEEFTVSALRVQGNWAFASVERSNMPEAGQGTHLAFLKRSGSGWKVMWSDNNDQQEVGAEALIRLRKKYKDFKKQLADFAGRYLAG